MMFTSLFTLAVAAQPMRFEDAVQRALEHHPTMKLARADTERALGQLEQARSASLPYLGVNAVGTQLDADRVLNDRVISAATQVAANVQLQVPLIVPNRWAAWRRAGAAYDATKVTVNDYRRLVAVAAGRSWLQVLAQQRVVDAAQRSRDVANAHLQYATDRHTAGIGSELDKIRAAQEVAVARQQLATATGNLKRLQELLGVSLGLDEPVSAIDEEPALAVKEQVDESAKERTDVVAARARVEAAEVATSWDWSDYTPLLTAIVQPGYQNPPTLTVPLWSFQAQLVLTIPLYEGHLRWGQQRERRANELAAKSQLENLQRQASAEVRAALAQVSQADEALSAARDASTQARRTLELSQQAFKAGASTNIEVVDAERRARDAETAVALAEDASRQARLEVLAASGRFPATEARKE